MKNIIVQKRENLDQQQSAVKGAEVIRDTLESIQLDFVENALEKLPQRLGLKNTVKVNKMATHNNLANMLSKILNADTIGKPEVTLSPYSRNGEKVLQILKDRGYIGEFKIEKEIRGGTFVVSLIGKINKVGVISPNFNVKKVGYESYEKRFLPAKGFGMILVTTTKGLMTHYEAKEQNLGGRLVAYCY